MEWQTARRTLTLGTRPLVMGILNLTPDSFSDGGKWTAPGAATTRALELERAGADILDIGAESTRPGAVPILGEEEAKRLYPVLERLKGRISIPISVDTTKASVAWGAIDRGAEIINDVSGGRLDPMIWDAVAETKAGYVLMHSRGTPRTMHELAAYKDTVSEVAAELRDRFDGAVMAGIEPGRIALDPGIGFAKTGDQNLALLAGLDRIGAVAAGRPVLVGLSRKSFLGRFGGDTVAEALTHSAETYAMLRGARIVRTHDVAAARAAINFLEHTRRFEPAAAATP